LIWGGSPAEIVKSAERGEVHIVASMEKVGEISDVLAYPRLERLYSVAGVSRRDLLEAVLRVARLVEVDVSVDAVDRDPSDDKFIECALAGGAGYVVSGDRDLLELGRYRGVRVVRVGEFLELLGHSPP